MRILLVGYKHRSLLATEVRFREELFSTPGLDVHAFGWGYNDREMDEGMILSDKIESLGGVDVILYSVFWQRFWQDCFNESKALKVSIAPDLYDGAYRERKYFRHYKHMKFDVVLTYGGTLMLAYLKRMDICNNMYSLPHGVDTELFKKHDLEKSIDVFAVYTTNTRKPDVFPYRIKIHEMLREMPVVSYTKYVNFEALPRMISMSKIAVNCNARFNFINPRVTETISCGTFLLTSYCGDLAKHGYKDGEHLVTFDNMDDFKDKVEYYLEHEEEREEIAENGMNFVRENYNNKKRVDTLIKCIRNHL